MLISKENTGIAIWLGIFALLIPVVLLLAIKSPSLSKSTIDVEIASVLSSGKILKVAESDGVKAILIENEDNVSLVIQCKRAFENTSALVYELRKGKKGKLQGQLIKEGSYIFSSNASLSGIVLIDPIYKKEIISLKF